MGRKLYRVPLDFEWPLKQIWKGYINPFKSQDCKACDQTGYNPETKKIADSWYDFAGIYSTRETRWSNNLDQDDVQALVDADRLWDFTRVPRNEQQRADLKKKMEEGNWGGWLPYNNGYVPTAQEVNEWNRRGLGHDAINRYICVEAKAKRLGVYGKCQYCNGDGEIWQSEEIKRLHEEWEPIEPPEGEGYQLWETTTEGSPVSPVFATLDELCVWCEKNATTFGSFKAGRAEWRKMLGGDNVHHKDGNAIFL